MKEGALAGKRSVAEPCLPSAKEGGIERKGGQSLPGPGGEMWLGQKAVVLR